MMNDKPDSSGHAEVASDGATTKFRSWQELWERHGERRLVKASILASVMLFALMNWYGPDAWPTVSMALLMATAFAFSGAVWLHGKVKWLLRSSLIVNGFHVLVAFVAAVPARDIASKALQLPPHDFDLSVALITGALYLPVWGMLAGLLIALAAVCLLAYALVAALVVGTAVGPPLQSFLSGTRWQVQCERWLARVRDRAERYGVRGLGSFVVAGGLTLLSAFVFQAVQSQLPMVRWVAYWADYQDPGRYPCVTNAAPPGGSRVRLHENGIISVARTERFDVKVAVYLLDLSSCELRPK